MPLAPAGCLDQSSMTTLPCWPTRRWRARAAVQPG
jgi:hypothetical protein